MEILQPTRSGSRIGACLLLAAMLSLLSACGGKSNLPTEPTPSIRGLWEGAIDSPTDGPGTITLDLTQTGVTVSGPVQISQNGNSSATATLTGTLASPGSTTLQFTVTYLYGLCPGTFSGTLDVTSGEMTGPYSGHDCAHEFTGTLHAIKSD
jgi:hypothetical protein